MGDKTHLVCRFGAKLKTRKYCWEFSSTPRSRAYGCCYQVVPFPPPPQRLLERGVSGGEVGKWKIFFLNFPITQTWTRVLLGTLSSPSPRAKVPVSCFVPCMYCMWSRQHTRRYGMANKVFVCESWRHTKVVLPLAVIYILYVTMYKVCMYVCMYTYKLNEQKASHGKTKGKKILNSKSQPCQKGTKHLFWTIKINCQPPWYAQDKNRRIDFPSRPA